MLIIRHIYNLEMIDEKEKWGTLRYRTINAYSQTFCFIDVYYHSAQVQYHSQSYSSHGKASSQYPNSFPLVDMICTYHSEWRNEGR